MRAVSSKTADKPNPRRAIVRRTITIPGELDGWVERQSSQPQHMGNVSSYVRSLVIEDMKRMKEAA